MKLTSLRLRRALASLDAPNCTPDALLDVLVETLHAVALQGLSSADATEIARKAASVPVPDAEKNEVNAATYALIREACTALGAHAERTFRTHPSPSALVGWRAATLDRVRMLEVGLHVRACTPCLDEVRLLARMQLPAQRPASLEPVQSPEVWLRAAAKSHAPIRPPHGGALLWSQDGAELLRFNDADGVRLALYVEQIVTARVESDALRTEDMQPGYWLGSVAAGVERLEARVIVGDHAVDVVLDVPHIDD